VNGPECTRIPKPLHAWRYFKDIGGGIEAGRAGETISTLGVGLDHVRARLLMTGLAA